MCVHSCVKSRRPSHVIGRALLCFLLWSSVCVGVCELCLILVVSYPGRAYERKALNLPTTEITAFTISKTPVVPGCSSESVEMFLLMQDI